MRFINRFFAIAMVSFSVVANAQQQHNFFATQDDGEIPKLFFGGLTAGANFTQVDGDGFSGYHKVGLNLGAVVYMRFNDHFGASMELIYSQKGTRERNYTEDAAGVGYVNDYDMKLNYAEVPIMLRYFANNRLHFGLGVSYGYLISSKETAVTYAPVNLDSSIFSFRKSDLNFLADINYEFYKGWFIGMRFGYSLMSIRDGNHIPQYYGGDRFGGQYNNLFTARVTYLIH